MSQVESLSECIHKCQKKTREKIQKSNFYSIFIASGITIYDWLFGTLPFRLFGSNLDKRDLETYPRTYSGHF